MILCTLAIATATLQFSDMTVNHNEMIKITGIKQIPYNKDNYYAQLPQYCKRAHRSDK